MAKDFEVRLEPANTYYLTKLQTILGDVCESIFFGAVFFILAPVLLFGYVKHETYDRYRANGPPYARPGRRVTDYTEKLFIHPLQRRQMRQRRQQSKRDGMIDSRLPLELCVIVLDELHGIDSLSLRACSLICTAWTRHAYVHIFRNVRIYQHKAYSLLSLFRSPYRSPFLQDSFHTVQLNGDNEWWSVVELTLLNLVTFGVTLDTLDICLSVSSMKKVMHGRLRKEHIAPLNVRNLICTFERNRWLPSQHPAMFVEAFPSLVSLSFVFVRSCDFEINPNLVGQPWKMPDTLERLSFRFSPLRNFTTRSDFLRYILDRDIPNLKEVELLGIFATRPTNVGQVSETDQVRSCLERHRQISRLTLNWRINESFFFPLEHHKSKASYMVASSVSQLSHSASAH